MPKHIEQYNRIHRWFNKINNLSSERDLNLNDLGYSFFTCCWHLWDWISKDETLNLEVRKLAEGFAKNSEYLKICEGICVSSKHAVISDTRVQRDTSLNTAMYVHNISGPGAAHVSAKLFVYVGTKKYDFCDFAKSCINEWDSFFKANNVPIPTKR